MIPSIFVTATEGLSFNTIQPSIDPTFIAVTTNKVTAIETGMNRQMIWTELSSCKASRTLLLHFCSGHPDQQKRWSSHRPAPLLMQVQLCSKQFNQSRIIFSQCNIFFTLFLRPPPPLHPLPSPTFFLSLSLSKQFTHHTHPAFPHLLLRRQHEGMKAHLASWNWVLRLLGNRHF